MTPAEFRRIGERMYGRKHWRREYSVNLGLDPSTVWRISTRPGEIPAVIEVAVKGLLEKHKLIARSARELREQRARQTHTYRGRLTRKKKVVKKRPRKLIRYAGAPQREDSAEPSAQVAPDPAPK